MNPASTPSDEWLSLPAAERAQTFQAKKLWQRFIIVARRPGHQFPVRDRRVHDHLRDDRLSDHAADRRRGRPRAAPPQRGRLPAGRPDRRRRRQRDRHLRRPADLCRAAARASRCDFSVERGGRDDRDRRDAARRRSTRDRFGNQARIGRLGIGPSGALEFAPAAARPSCPARRSARRSIPSQTMVTALGQVITGRRSRQRAGRAAQDRRRSRASRRASAGCPSSG